MTEFLSLNELLVEREDTFEQYNAICYIGKCWKALWDIVSCDAWALGQAENWLNVLDGHWEIYIC